MPDQAAILARFALFAFALGLAGVPLHLRIGGTLLVRGRLRWLLGLAAVLSIGVAIWWAAASVAAMAAMPLGDLDRATFDAVVGATPIGLALKIKLAATAAFLAALILAPRTGLLAILGTVALAAGALTGHAGATEGAMGTVHQLSDVLHLLGAAVWIGALFSFLSAVIVRQEGAIIRDLERFARTGTAVVVVLSVTGALNAWLIGRLGWSVTSTWSILLAIKIALFGAMLGLAALNRWRLTPALASGQPGARRRLRLSLTLETACALAIVLLVAVLGLSDPSGA